MEKSEPTREYHSNRNTDVVVTIIVDQVATANVCSLLFLGILAGTKLAQYIP